MHEGLAWAEDFETVRLLLERLPMACIVNDSQFRFVYWNPAAEALFGYAFEEVRGKHPFGIITPPASQPLVEDFFRRLAQGDMGASGVGENVTKSGRIVTCDWTNTPIRAKDGTFLGIISLAHDLTDRIERENERARLESELRHAQKMEALGTLAGGIAHDFNNILAAIIAVVELGLLDLQSPKSVERNFREILAAAQRAGALVKQILMFSRRADQSPEPTALGPIVREVANLLRATIPKSVELEIAIGASDPPVLADGAQIHQVIMNLATNAWQAIGNESGGRIVIGHEQVAVDANLRAHHAELVEPSYVRIWVSDNGAGMDAATLERIFEPFFTTKAAGEGTGLGLSVVHGIVTQHRGTLAVDSRLGGGSTISVYLPAHVAANDASDESRMSGELGAGERVLVVDDEPAVASAVGALLERLGYRVEVHIGADTALAAFRREPCDVLVSDLTMPGMTGLELAQLVQSIKAETPVVLTSGYGTGVSQTKLDQCGVASLLHKPYTQLEIARAVKAALARR